MGGIATTRWTGSRSAGTVRRIEATTKDFPPTAKTATGAARPDVTGPAAALAAASQ